MAGEAPTTTIDARFSDEGATPTPWQEGRTLLEAAELFWISTVRPDGRPHVTPLIAGWLDGALYFVTGPQERKALNLETNPHCVFTTGCNKWREGMDLVVEGEAVRVTDDQLLRRLSALYDSKYSWHFDIHDGSFWEGDHEAYVFGISPVTAFGFGKGRPYSQTRWRFERTESAL